MTSCRFKATHFSLCWSPIFVCHVCAFVRHCTISISSYNWCGNLSCISFMQSLVTEGKILVSNYPGSPLHCSHFPLHYMTRLLNDILGAHYIGMLLMKKITMFFCSVIQRGIGIMGSTAPKPVTAPESAHVHFILHIEHCTVHTTHLYCMLHPYQDVTELELKLVAAKLT